MGDILVLSYVLLAWGLNLHEGMYTPRAFFLVAIAYVLIACVLIALPALKKKPNSLVPSITALVAGASVLLTLQYTSSPLLYPASSWFETAVHATNAVVLCITLLQSIALFPKIRSGLLGLATVTALALRLFIPIASPEPLVDVHSLSQQSAEHMRLGNNPYTAPMNDIYHGSFRTVEHYAYPPASLYPQFVGYVLFGDIRYALIAAEFLFVWILWIQLRKTRWPADKAFLLLLLFLYHPRGMFVLEQGWMEPMMLGAFSLTLLLLQRSKKMLAAVTYGWFLASKQSVLLLLLPYVIVEKRPWRWLMVAIAGLLTLIPFALWDMESLWNNGILFGQNTWLRTDSLSLGSFLHPYIGETGTHAMLFIGAAAAIALTLRFRRAGLPGFVSACVLTLFSILVLGSHAFCNFYYLAGGMLLTLFAVYDPKEYSVRA